MTTNQDARLDQIERQFGTFGGREVRVMPITVEEIRDSGKAPGNFTVRGHAAVFSRWSLDLGGFREKIAPGAFDNVLGGNPDVHLLWDHDSRWVLGRTTNKTLELRVDPAGLHYWGRVAPTSYAADLRVLLERGDVDQASFAFTVPPEGQTWVYRTDENGQEIVERTINEVSALYDVTITAQGAYPQTDSQVVRSLAQAYARTLPLSDFAAEEDEPLDGDPAPAPQDDLVLDAEPVDELVPTPDPGTEEGETPEPDEAERLRQLDELKTLKAGGRNDVRQAKLDLLRLGR